ENAGHLVTKEELIEATWPECDRERPCPGTLRKRGAPGDWRWRPDHHQNRSFPSRLAARVAIMDGLFVKRVGHGPRGVLLHGGVGAGELCWRPQLPLADRFALEIVDRAGYGRSQQVSLGEDLDADAPLVAEILADKAHLVGHSSGAVAAMMAAALRPQAVLSLTLCEPVAFQLAPRSAEAQQMARDLDRHLRQPGDDAEWLRGFLAIISRDLVIPDQLPPPLAQGVRAIRVVRRRPWEGELSVDQLAAARFPKLVISGNHSRAFEAV